MMNFYNIETIFNRAFFSAFEKKKLIWTSISLLFCAAVFVLIYGLGAQANGWTLLSVMFIPVFISFGVLFSLGIFLSRVYYHERKGQAVSNKEILIKSIKLLAGGAYFMLPFLLVYFILWSLFGVFHALAQIPAVGNFISILLAFTPFVVILASIILMVVGVVLLFCCAPSLALGEKSGLEMLLILRLSLKKYFLSHCMFILLGILPVLIGGGVCLFAAEITVSSVFNSTNIASFQFLFILIPLCGLISPFVVSFFHLAVEAYNAIQKREKSCG